MHAPRGNAASKYKPQHEKRDWLSESAHEAQSIAERPKAALSVLGQTRAIVRMVISRAATSPMSRNKIAMCAQPEKTSGNFEPKVAPPRQSRRLVDCCAVAPARSTAMACPLKQQCRPNLPMRKILRSVHEEVRDAARRIAATEEYALSRRQRKKVDKAFAHLKRILKLDRLRLRGPRGVNDEFLLAATAQNLRKMARLAPA